MKNQKNLTEITKEKELKKTKRKKRSNEFIPNKETELAIEIGLEMSNSSRGKAYDDLDEFWKDLLSDGD